MQHDDTLYGRVKNGILTVSGNVAKITVDGGMLRVADGYEIDSKPTAELRFRRAGCPVSRIIVTRPDGFITFAAIKWLHGVGASLFQLDWDGTPLMTTTPRPSGDFPALRRAQARAAGSDLGQGIARELLGAKLTGQGAVLRFMGYAEPAETIDGLAGKLAAARSDIELLSVEALAAIAYWAAWAPIPVRFARRDGVPEHWRSFGGRKSPISSNSNSPSDAATPGNALLNYLYGVMASQCIAALNKCGLDPGLGILHADKPGRASLAYDIMETVRPVVDLWLFDWLKEATFAKRDFGEGSDGTIRISRPLSSHLAMTAALWRSAADDVAAWMAKRLTGDSAAKLRGGLGADFRVEARRHAVRWKIRGLVEDPIPRLCLDCGKALPSRHRKFCSDACAASYHGGAPGTHSLAAIAARFNNTPEATAQRSARIKANRAAEASWRSRPGWSEAGDETLREWYASALRPALLGCRSADIRRVMGLSLPTAIDVRMGRVVPHPRHYAALATLARIEIPMLA